MVFATATDVENNFDEYLDLVQSGQEIIILEDGAEVARLISRERKHSFLSDSLVGITSHDIREKEIRSEQMSRYDSTT